MESIVYAYWTFLLSLCWLCSVMLYRTMAMSKWGNCWTVYSCMAACFAAYLAMVVWSLCFLVHGNGLSGHCGIIFPITSMLWCGKRVSWGLSWLWTFRSNLCGFGSPLGNYDSSLTSLSLPLFAVCCRLGAKLCNPVLLKN